MHELVEPVEANEPRILAYNVYFTDDDTRMTVVHVHPDSTSLEFHRKVAGPAFPKFVEFIRLLRIDICGQLSGALLGQMRRKVQMLGNATVLVYGLHAGFSRFGIR